MFGLITKFSGKSHSDLIRKYFYNIIGKIFILFQADNDDNIQRQITPLREPNYLFATCFLEQLKQREVPKRNTAAVLQLLTEAAANVIGLLPILLKEETVQKAIIIIDLFQQESFVDFVLKDSSNEVERVLVIDALEKVLNGGNDSSQTQSMLVKTRMQHRKRILSELCTKPTLISFLKSDEASVLINDWAVGLGDKNTLHRLQFHTAVEEFKSLETRALMPSRASLICERYIEIGADCEVVISKSAKDGVLEQLRNDKITRSTFAAAQKEVVLSLNNEFVTSFLPSSHFQQLKSELETIKTKLGLLFREENGEESRGSFLGGVGSDVIIDPSVDDDNADIGVGEANERLSTLWK